MEISTYNIINDHGTKNLLKEINQEWLKWVRVVQQQLKGKNPPKKTFACFIAKLDIVSDNNSETTVTP